MANTRPSMPFIPDHTLIRMIGQGTYGQVWLAKNLMGVYRAVKIIKRDDFKDPSPLDRELRGIQKFEPISRSHPGFINLLHVGRNDEEDYLYYVMELGDDLQNRTEVEPEDYQVKTLFHLLRHQGAMEVDSCLQLGLRLSDALAQLHREGLVHRDIKPSNIIFVQNTPKLADIGLVTLATEAQTLVGTLGFIPPEGPGTEQADIYALGKVLYECLSGLDRHHFPDIPTFWDQHTQKPRVLELNEVILKASHNDSARRYKTARQMHAELMILENGESIIRLRSLERKWSYFKRLARVTVMSLAVIAAAALWGLRELNRLEADRQRKVGTLTANSVRSLEEGSYAQSLVHMAEVLSLVPKDHAEPLNRIRFGSTLSQHPKLTLLRAYSAKINWCEFSPDGQRMLIALDDGGCHLRQISTGRLLTEFVGHSQGVLMARFGHEGRYVATASADRTARLWNATSGQVIANFPHPCLVASLAIHPYEELIATGGDDGLIRLWPFSPSKEPLRHLEGHTKRIDGLNFSPKGLLLASASRDQTVRFWNTETCLPEGSPLPHPNWVFGVAFSPDGSRLASACADNAAYVWSLDQPHMALPPLRHDRIVRHAEFSPDGRFIATGGWDDLVRLWDASTGFPVNPSLHHSSAVMHIAFGPDAHRLIVGCTDGSIRIWDRAGCLVPTSWGRAVFSEDGSHALFLTRDPLQVRCLKETDHRHQPLATRARMKWAKLSRTGDCVAAVLEASHPERDDSLHIQAWDSFSGKALSPPLPYQGSAQGFCINSQAGLLAAVEGKTVRVCSFKSGNPQNHTFTLDDAFPKILFSPSGRELITICGAKVQILESSTGRQLHEPLTNSLPVGKVVVDPQDQRMAICTSDQLFHSCYAQVFDIHAGAYSGEKLWHGDGILDAVWISNGRQLVLAGEDGLARIWNLAQGQPVGVEMRHGNQILDLEYAANPPMLLTASWDRQVRLWDPKSGLPLSPYLQHPYALDMVRYSQAHRCIIAREVGDLHWIWPLPLDSRPARVLLEHSRLLASMTRRPMPAEALQLAGVWAERWNQCQKHSSRFFAVSEGERIAWHRYEAEFSKVEKNYRAELFHLNRLLNIVTNDANALKRKARLEEKLKEQGNASGP